MAESYSDEQFLRWSEMMPSETEEDSLAARWAATVRRLMRERDKARRVAKVLAERGRATEEYNAAQRTALAYPEAP